MDRLPSDVVIHEASIAPLDLGEVLVRAGGEAILRDTLSPSCWLLRNFFSPAQCDAEIADATRKGFGGAHTAFPPTYRNNERCVIDEEGKATHLFSRLLTYLARDRHSAACPVPALTHRDADGNLWHLRGINPRLRYCRYRPRQAFFLHQDGVRHESPVRRSFFTFMVYLDDPGAFKGGATRFFAAGPGAVHNPPLLCLYPPRGSLIVFDHALWHDGDEVLAGVKHVLRSDLMFELESASAAPPPHSPSRGAFCAPNTGYVWRLHPLLGGGIASAGRDARVRLWTGSGDLQGELRGHSQSVLALTQLSASHLYTLSRDSSLRLWNLATRTEEARVERAHVGAGLVLACAGRTVLSGGADGCIREWSAALSPLRRIDNAHDGWVWDLAVLGASHVVSVGEDGVGRVWRLTDLAPVAALAAAAPLRAVATQAAGGGVDGVGEGSVIVVGDVSGALHVWRAAEDGSAHRAPFVVRTAHRGDAGWRRTARLQVHSGAVRALRWVRGGLASASEDFTVRLTNVASGAGVVVARHANFATDVLELHERRVVSVGYDGVFRVNALDELRSDE